MAEIERSGPLHPVWPQRPSRIVENDDEKQEARRRQKQKNQNQHEAKEQGPDPRDDDDLHHIDEYA